jgi:DNA-damage-inducible protein D
MSTLKAKEYQPFEAIKHIADDGTEFWYARELAIVLEYVQWRNFAKVLNRAKLACKNSGYSILDHFAEVSKIVKAGATSKPVVDFMLTRYACYLIVQNGDPRKEVIALGQTYFAIQTRRQEVADYFNQLDEDNKRLVIRGDIKQWNQMLAEAAHNAGVISNDEYATFQNADANEIHFIVGREVRGTIERVDGTMPEDLPTPNKSISDIEQEQLKRLKNRQNKLMLDE